MTVTVERTRPQPGLGQPNPEDHQVRLEPFTGDDVERLMAWLPDSRAVAQWAGRSMQYPLDPDQFTDHFRTLSEPVRILGFRITKIKSDRIVGHIELSEIDRDRGIAWIMRVLVGPRQMRGRGIASQALAQVCGMAFSELGLNKLKLRVYDFNIAAIRCYEKAGFRILGYSPHPHCFEGEVWPTLTMELTAKTWRDRNRS